MKFSAIPLLTLLSLTSAAPAIKRWPTDPTIIKPTYIHTYNINTGALTYAPPLAISSFPKTTSTISTFTVPAGLSGRKCRLGFYISPSDTKSTLTSTTGVQVFSTNSVPPARSVASWGPPGNQRSQHYGNLKLVKPGDGVVDDWPRLLESFDCPAQGTYAWEIVAKWDVAVQWDPVVSGLYVKPL
jgi:hypothetical protein